MEHGPKLSMAMVRPLPTVAGKVAEFALTTPPGEKVSRRCQLKPFMKGGHEIMTHICPAW